jgi:hypothetical protein
MLRLQIIERLSYDIELVDLRGDLGLVLIPLVPDGCELLVHILKLVSDGIEGLVEPGAVERTSGGRRTSSGLEIAMLVWLWLSHWCRTWVRGRIQKLTL